MAKSKAEQWLEPDNLKLLEAWARDGLTDAQISHNMGITTTCLYNYKNKYIDIFNALKKGKQVVDIEVENALYKNATGFSYIEEVVSTKREVIYEDGKRVKEISEPVVLQISRYKQPETTAQIFWLKNRKPDVWRDKIIDVENEEAINNATELLVKIRKTVDDRYERS